MVRLLYTSPNPYPQVVRLSALTDYTVFTSSRLAARALGVYHQSLVRGASKQLERSGWAIASTLKAQSLFRQVLQDGVQPTDLIGTANGWLPTEGKF